MNNLWIHLILAVIAIAYICAADMLSIEKREKSRKASEKWNKNYFRPLLRPFLHLYENENVLWCLIFPTRGGHKCLAPNISYWIFFCVISWHRKCLIKFDCFSFLPFLYRICIGANWITTRNNKKHILNVFFFLDKDTVVCIEDVNCFWHHHCILAYNIVCR